MKNLTNPRWLLILNTIPLIILFILCFSQYNIIKSLLSEENICLWKIFAGVLLGLGVINLIYTGVLIVGKKKLPLIYGIISFIAYVAFIYAYAFNIDNIVPFSIPDWMEGWNVHLYVGTFLMPTMAHSLFICIVNSVKENKNGAYNFLVILIPIVIYLFSQLLLPTWKWIDQANFNIHFYTVSISVITIVFLFFLVRGVYMLATKHRVSAKFELLWKIPIAVIFPILGLLLNNGYIVSVLGEVLPFGDFTDNTFYILAILNGIFICLPNIENRIYRFFLFMARSFSFAYTFYFFIVFLPFLPLSIFAILAMGLGFLMLTPLVLFVIHINTLSVDYKYLRTFIPKTTVIVAAVIGFLALPTIITFLYKSDRSILNSALNYLDKPNYTQDYNINKSSLEKTLNKINTDYRGTPYLSAYFKWLVLDNLTLTQNKTNTLQSIFFNNYFYNTGARNSRTSNSDVNITDISTSSTYNEEQNAWLSWVNLEITNNSNFRIQEYATTISLPKACWISNYYLYVEDVKEMGILAEKKAAMWIFAQIRNDNKDPGILYYLSEDKVAFRVFPFADNEVRKTGIQFVHKEPLVITMDGNQIKLGDNETKIREVKENYNEVVYVSPAEKQNLDTIRRTPYYHFILDISAGSHANISHFTKEIDSLLSNNKELAQNARLSFVNTYVTTFDINDNWHDIYNKQVFEGGFFLERAFQKILYNSYIENKETYPVIIVFTNDFSQAVLTKSLSDMAFTYPEASAFHYKEPNNEPMIAKSITGNSIKANNTVLKYIHQDGSIVYIPNDNMASIVLKNSSFDIDDSKIKETDWNSGLLMQAKYMSMVLHPQTTDKEWLNLVKYSFRSGIMNPLTSYLVVENEAQKAMLKKKQRQTLAGNSALDLGDEADEMEQMSEPNLLLLISLLIVILGIVKYNKKKKRIRITR